MFREYENIVARMLLRGTVLKNLAVKNLIIYNDNNNPNILSNVFVLLIHESEPARKVHSKP